ncbi:mas-related G-protein coupled receptor member X1-like [Sminthopsis crassicaudata]|uniref:mas-related G-protein coupled receptor member X1-like n=1 Tax=Sminthopsis crassicaudata TaxID=9301 RepID=UPI003D686486
MTGGPTTEYPGYYFENLTENSENESSCGSLDVDNWMQILILLLAPLGLLGNGAVLWLLGFRVRRTPFSVYILNLAAADALFLCSAFLISIDAFFGSIFDHLAKIILRFLRFISYTAGLSLLAAISTERCLSALFPVWYRCHCPKRTAASVCAVLWTLAGMLRAIYFFRDLEFRRIFYAVYFLLLTCVLCASSLTLLLRVRCGSRRPRPPRLSLLVLLTVLVFLLCGLPWGVGDVVYFHLHIDFIPYWLYDLLACVNSSVNPLIYFFVGRLGHKRREPLRLVLQRALGDEQESGSGTTDPPQPSQETTL